MTLAKLIEALQSLFSKKKDPVAPTPPPAPVSPPTVTPEPPVGPVDDDKTEECKGDDKKDPEECKDSDEEARHHTDKWRDK